MKIARESSDYFVMVSRSGYIQYVEHWNVCLYRLLHLAMYFQLLLSDVFIRKRPMHVLGRIAAALSIADSFLPSVMVSKSRDSETDPRHRAMSECLSCRIYKVTSRREASGVGLNTGCGLTQAPSVLCELVRDSNRMQLEEGIRLTDWNTFHWQVIGLSSWSTGMLVFGQPHDGVKPYPRHMSTVQDGGEHCPR